MKYPVTTTGTTIGVGSQPDAQSPCLLRVSYGGPQLPSIWQSYRVSPVQGPYASISQPPKSLPKPEHGLELRPEPESISASLALQPQLELHGALSLQPLTWLSFKRPTALIKS